MRKGRGIRRLDGAPIPQQSISSFQTRTEDPSSSSGMGFLLSLSEVAGSNPASPISRYSGEDVLSEEFPEGWWGRWVFQRATESLPTNHSFFVAVPKNGRSA
jgi:hypothetical protein